MLKKIESLKIIASTKEEKKQIEEINQIINELNKYRKINVKNGSVAYNQKSITINFRTY